MKPIKLTMKAFGSFAKETTIDFQSFHSDLFLVVGDTGAGKTTIFDAIVFALYGTASGSGRKPEMMHSDYVEKSEDTVVKLVFEQGGREYTVTRTIHFRKKQGTENEYGKGVVDAVLVLPDGQPVRVATNVTKRCEELLGLKAEQFRRIVMLAQGEFRQFLEANAKDKSEILGKLFDNSEYLRFQNLLEQSRDALKLQREGFTRTVRTQMQSVFQTPASETPESAFLYLADHPDLIGNLDKLIASEEQKAVELEAVKSEAQRAVDAINKQKGAAAGDNKLLEELANANRHLEVLDQKQEEMERLQQEFELAEKALHQCKPLQTRWVDAKARLNQTVQTMEALKKRILELRELCVFRQAEVAGDQEKKKRIDAINLESKSLSDSLPRYDALERKRSERERAERDADKLKKDLEHRQAEEQSRKEKWATCQNELTKLENAGAEEISRKSSFEMSKRAVDEFRQIKGEVKRIQTSELELERARETLQTLTKQAFTADEAHHRIYRSFITGQAGLLASELEKSLLEDGIAVCPVCRSEFHSGEPHSFAELVEGTPTQDAVNKARKRFERNEKARAEQATAVETLNAALGERRENLLRKAKELLPDCENWEQMSSARYLAQSQEVLNRARAEAEAQYLLARQRRERQTELSKQQKQMAQEIDSLGAEIREKSNAHHGALVRITGLKTEEDALWKGLPFAAKSEAGERLQALRKEKDCLQSILQLHLSALEEAAQMLNSAQGGWKEKNALLPGQQAEETEAQTVFEAALARNGFENAEKMEQALAIIGRENGELWLKKRQQALNGYRNDVENTRSRAAELRERTKQLSYTNLEELDQTLRAAKERRDGAERASTEQNGLLRNHKRVRQSVFAAQNELKKTDKAWEKLDRLAELAAGAKSDGGKLSFERYVMGSIFREVLDMANRRLDIMSGGHYELVHTVSGTTARSAAGLEIEVLDVITGKQRSASSVSGGESFQVSLSLALGLSDVVQSHAGGIGLDTIFIDEGFGTLDGSALDSAITVLRQLTVGNRLVGIISHVDKLEESIPQKLRVKKTGSGSELSVELS